MRLIDADALMNLPFEKMIHTDYGDTCVPIEEIETAPTVEYPFYQEAYQTGYEEGKNKRPQGEWIPIKYRPMTSEERKEFAEYYGIEYCDTLEEKAFDCPMPEDGQKILISTLWGVDIDVADNDIDGGFICYGLEGNGDWSGVNAWRPLPERYKESGQEVSNDD